jgi:hypothetical protein
MTGLKTNCRECNAEILATTAESTGGLCMPCKNGTRKRIEEGRRYHEERKKYDPWRELWTSLVKRAYAIDEGWRQFSDIERLYYSVSILNGEVYNGGMHQFFANSSGELYSEALSGLETLGAEETKRLLLNASSVLFDDVEPPSDRAARWDAMKQYPETIDRNALPDWCERLHEIDKAYWRDPDDLNTKLTSYAEQNGLIAPYLLSNEQNVGPKPPTDLSEL